MAATASMLNQSSTSSPAARQRGEGRSPEPPCLTTPTGGLTNDGGMTANGSIFFGIDTTTDGACHRVTL
jgi:hypothetical protein